MTSSRFEHVARACDLLSTWTGFEFRDAAPNRLADFLESRSALLGFAGVGAYLDELARSTAGGDEPQRLINLITNGLTVFWRDEPQLEALRAVLRDLSKRRGATVNVWCAGCSTGEEAYTAAMIAHEERVSASIVGTDINTDFLARARSGRYDTWSLRRLSDERRARWFDELGREQWRISDELQKSVSFRKHNLLETSPLPPQRADWDIVMCRNVLIYFGESSTRRVLSHFSDAIELHDGYLILGSSEHLSGPEELIFRASRASDGFVYRHVKTSPGRTVQLGLGAVDLPSQVPVFEPTSLDEETIDFGEDDAVSRLLEAGRQHLGIGRVEPALACFEAAAGYDPFVPETYCLLGHAFEGADAPNEALDCYQKALFLDPAIWFAAWRTAVIAEGLDEPGVARRALRAVERALTSGPRTELSARLVGDSITDLRSAEREARQALGLNPS